MASGPSAESRPAGLLGLVSDQLATEREMAALRARDRARDVERSRFVSTVAHELRAPLTGLSGYLDFITGGRVDDPAIEPEFLERSRQIVGSMNELVGDLLELARHGRMRSNHSPGHRPGGETDQPMVPPGAGTGASLR